MEEKLKKIYIAGPLCEKENRDFLEQIDKICKDLGFDTFLPHRDVGLYGGDQTKIKSISERDLNEIKTCDLMIGVLNGIYVGAGTAWEMGYAQAIGKKVIGLKTDREVRESVSEVSVIIAGQVDIAENIEELKNKLVDNSRMESRMKYNTKCKFFNEKYACDTLSSEGYESCEECKFNQEYSKKILIIKLGAMGDVLRTTCILPALKKKYGEDILIYWMTNTESVDLLKNNHLIDKILPYNPENLLRIQQEKFDILFSLEINTPATLFANLVNASEKFGYYFNNGSTACFNSGAEHYLDTAFLHHMKLKNKKTYQQLIFHACNLQDHYTKQRPIFNLNQKHLDFAKRFKNNNNIKDNEEIIGINIGSADRWKSKFWNNEKVKQLIRQLRGCKIIILGGPNEVEKQQELIDDMKQENIFLLKNNPENSIDEFASIVNLCNKIICGDTMTLHLASALEKQIIALFFANPHWEIEDYEYLKKIFSPLLEKYFYTNKYIEELANSISIEQVLKALESN